jgi:hypothetical protein
MTPPSVSVSVSAQLWTLRSYDSSDPIILSVPEQDEISIADAARAVHSECMHAVPQSRRRAEKCLSCCCVSLLMLGWCAVLWYLAPVSLSLCLSLSARQHAVPAGAGVRHLQGRRTVQENSGQLVSAAATALFCSLLTPNPASPPVPRVCGVHSALSRSVCLVLQEAGAAAPRLPLHAHATGSARDLRLVQGQLRDRAQGQVSE